MLSDARPDATWHPSTVDGYDADTYGDAFADIYDEWYADVTDVDGTVALVSALAPGGRVLELGVGTGRIALPLADAGLTVVGCDASTKMLDRLAEKDPDGRIERIHVDMAADLPDGPFDIVLATYNTLFNLTSLEAQRRCLRLCRERLAPRGGMIVETFVPVDDADSPNRGLSTRTVEVDRVVLTASRQDHARQIVDGQMIEISEAGIRMRPWSIRYLTPDQLDEEMAAAGLELDARWGDWRGRPFGGDDAHQVAVYVAG